MDTGMHSRGEIKVHVNRALRARTVEQKLDEIAPAIAELARYVKDIEKGEEHRRKALGE
jgi:hypothetical protein